MKTPDNDLTFDSAHVAVYKDPEHPLLVKAGNSLRKPIDLMCRSCIYDELDTGNWGQQVTACACDYCPLWEVRPVSKPDPRTTRREGGVLPDSDPQKGRLPGIAA
jgi:hypothetical protein